MKKIIQYIIPIIFIIFLVNPAYSFPPGATAQPGLNNTTESDQDIVLVQHLIEVDAVQLQSENKLLVRETLIFRNTGTKNFSGFLRTWVPDGAKDIKLARSEMMTGGGFVNLPFIQNGNIISWQDFVEKNSRLPFLYVTEYTLLQKPEGTFSKSQMYSKKLIYPTLINYKYTSKPGLPAIVFKVTKSEKSSITLLDENRNKISPDEVNEEGNSIINRFESPQFKELNIEISTPVATPAGIAGYVILGLVIVLVISYPLIRKKSEKIQALEEKIRSSLKREEAEETVEETVEEISEETIEETPSEVPAESGETVSPVEEDTEFEGKTREELENLKNEMLSKLSELDKEYASGNLMDEEYEELRKSYKEKAERITKKMEQL
jgi:hypothetical protein